MRMSEALPAESRTTVGWAVPRMVLIPEGWFLMGSDAGQENERPVHRVWVGAFALAACQTTNAEYEKFIAATGHRKPLHWGDPLFSHPEQPVFPPSHSRVVSYCEPLRARHGY